jgi:hypothetical protein
MFNDTVYTIRDDCTIAPRMALDPGKYGATLERRHKVTDPRENPFKYLASLHVIGESASYFFFSAFFRRETFCFLIDKQRHTLHNISLTLPEAMATEKPFIPQFVSEDNRRLVGIAENEDSDENPGLIVAALKDSTR